MKKNSFWKNRRVFISGGAGFLGSNLTNALIKLGAQTTIGDNLITGSIENVKRVWENNDLTYKKNSRGLKTNHNDEFIKIDFQDYNSTLKTLRNFDVIFHLAATIGGRGYIDTHPADCCENFAVNQNVIKAAAINKIERLIFASSACVYPMDLQKKYNSQYKLKETDAFKNNWADADREYGWSKLMGEMTLSAYCRQYGLKGGSVRYVTAYGPWENDTHAIIALIRRAVEHQDPYIVWGTGNQDRDFTFVDDIASGTIAAGQFITDGSAVNLGTGRRYTMKQVIEMIFQIINWRPKKIIFDKTKPEGVKTRALDIRLAKKVLHWQPENDLKDGLQKTIKWFIKTRPRSVEVIR